MMPLFVLIAVPLICRRLTDRPTSQSQPRRPQPAFVPWLNGAILAGMVAFAGVHTAQVIDRQPQAEMQSFPARAVAFLQTQPPSVPIFNHYDWGGYLVWKLYPATRVFIDGRADLYGERVLNQFADTYQFKGDWQQTLQRWNIDTVLVPPSSALATGLRSSPEWTVAYEDSQAVVLRAPPHAFGAERCPFAAGMQESTPLGAFAGYYEWDQLGVNLSADARTQVPERHGPSNRLGNLFRYLLFFRRAERYGPSLEIVARGRRTGHR
jgi:hypothetical protein